MAAWLFTLELCAVLIYSGYSLWYSEDGDDGPKLEHQLVPAVLIACVAGVWDASLLQSVATGVAGMILWVWATMREEIMSAQRDWDVPSLVACLVILPVTMLAIGAAFYCTIRFDDQSAVANPFIVGVAAVMAYTPIGRRCLASLY